MYAAKDDRIRVKHQKNGGRSAARNAGLDMAFENDDSDWICFVDSDDWVHTRYIELLYKAANDSKSKISACGYLETIEFFPPQQIDNVEVNDMPTEAFWLNEPVSATIPVCKLYSKELFLNVRYPIGKVHEDDFVTYKLLFSVDSFPFVKEALYYYFQNPEGIMRSNWTPARLTGLEAYVEQVQYFKNNRFDKACC